ncbi:MAG: TonB-dependent receptor, partial [Bacteroidales bacterium]|nr:TonB-dependent receptor [Bacteroidales bacterium]
WSEFTSSEYNSSIIDYGAASDFDFMATDRHTIKFGFNYIYHEFKPETSITKIKSKSSTNPENNVDSSSVIPGGKTIYANELSVYAEDEWKITRQLSAIPGFAYTLFKVQDKAYNTIQPRFSLKYTATPFWTFKASYTRMSQCVHLLSSSPLALPTDLWVPITQNIKPETADQYSVGAYCTKAKGWEFSVEGYYKELHNVLEYKDGMSFMGFSGNWQQMVAMGEGRSKGIEVLAKRTEGKATGWISYTLSKADRDFDNGSGVNNGRVFPFAYDRRHNISIVYSQKINDHIDFDANWTYFSGSHATISLSKETLILPTGVDPYDYWEYESGQTERPETKTDDIDFVENRNNYTLPASHLLCIGINFHKQKKHCERIFNISVYNAYNAKNPNFAFSKVKEKENPADPYNPTEYLVLRKLTILPIIPSFTFTYKF